MSQNIPATPDTPRVPHAAEGVDVNFCRNPKCSNFGVPIPPSAKKGRGSSNPYTVVAKGKNIPAARCNDCGEIITLKSNTGVLEESRRILAAHFPHPSCLEPLCANHRVPIHVKGACHAIGTTKLGSRRYRCLECKGSFSVKPEGINPIRNQRQSDKNRTILSMLTNKMPLRRICEAADVTPGVLYDRIDFLSSQAGAFLAEREKGFSDTDFKMFFGLARFISTSSPSVTQARSSG